MFRLTRTNRKQRSKPYVWHEKALGYQSRQHLFPAPLNMESIKRLGELPVSLAAPKKL